MVTYGHTMRKRRQYIDNSPWGDYAKNRKKSVSLDVLDQLNLQSSCSLNAVFNRTIISELELTQTIHRQRFIKQKLIFIQSIKVSLRRNVNLTNRLDLRQSIGLIVIHRNIKETTIGNRLVLTQSIKVNVIRSLTLRHNLNLSSVIKQNRTIVQNVWQALSLGSLVDIFKIKKVAITHNINLRQNFDTDYYDSKTKKTKKIKNK